METSLLQGINEGQPPSEMGGRGSTCLEGGCRTDMARVLVVDDEPDVLRLCHVNLEQEGYDVIEAPDGDQAIAEAFAQSPAAIVLDLMLPTIDGYEVLRRLREDARTGTIPIVVLTALAQVEDRRRCWRTGADDVVVKPFSPETLSEALRRVLALDADARRRGREDALRRLEP